MLNVKAGPRPAPWVVCSLLLFTLGAGCGYEGDLPTPVDPPSPPVPPSQAGVALTLSSSPIDALPAVDGGAPWSAEWTLHVQETAGIGGTIDFVNATLTDSGGALITETELGADELTEQLGSNRLEGGSNQDLFMSLNFDFPSADLSGSLKVTLQLSDDRGNTVASDLDDVIQICVPALLMPEEGAILDNGCRNGENGVLWEFDWSECQGAQAYHIYVRQRSAQEPVFDRPDLIDSSFTALDDRLATEDLRFDWYWQVRAKLNDTWGNWSPERNFEVEPVNTDCVTP